MSTPDPEQRVEIASLPHELLVTCLSHFNVAETCALRTVSHRFRDAAEDHTIWMPFVRHHWLHFPDVVNPFRVYSTLLGPPRVAVALAQKAFREQVDLQASGGTRLVDSAQEVAQSPRAAPDSVRPIHGFHLVWGLAGDCVQDCGLAFQCIDGMLDETQMPAGHTLPVNRPANLQHAHVACPTSPPPFGPIEPPYMTPLAYRHIRFRANERAGAPEDQLLGDWAMRNWLQTHMAQRLLCRLAVVHAGTSSVLSLGTSSLYSNGSYDGSNTLSRRFGFEMAAEFVLPTAALPAEMVREIAEDISMRYEPVDDGGASAEGHQGEPVRTLGILLRLTLMMARRDGDATRYKWPRRHADGRRATDPEACEACLDYLQGAPSAWTIRNFKVTAEPLLTFPSWHQYNPAARVPNPRTGLPWYICGSPFFTYTSGSDETTGFEATQQHHRTDAMASCMLNAAMELLDDDDGDDLIAETPPNAKKACAVECARAKTACANSSALDVDSTRSDGERRSSLRSSLRVIATSASTVRVALHVMRVELH